MGSFVMRISHTAFLFFCFALFHYGDADIPTYGLCDAGDVITSLNGSIIPSKGTDCTRVILAPSGWRIKFILDSNMRDAIHYLYDGGSRFGTLKFERAIRHTTSMPLVFDTSSNAILVHTDRIVSDDNKFNGTFEMYPQSAQECACLPTVDAETSCSFPPTDNSGRFYHDLKLVRKCITTCNQGDEQIQKTAYSANMVETSCHSGTWTKTNMFDQKLITCSPVTPVTQFIRVFIFSYVGLSCVDLNVTLIETALHQFLRGNRSASYSGECYKDVVDGDCTVQPVHASCSRNGNDSLVRLEMQDNVELTQNLTSTREDFTVLLSSVNNIAYFNKIKAYVINNLTFNGVKATEFQDKNHVFGSTKCPDGKVLTGQGDQDFPRKSCISCPVHHEKFYHSDHFFSECKICSSTKRRLSNESMCVNGSRPYSEPSNQNCHYRCGLGKYFNNISGICEWCPYGQFQNSTIDLNPVCQACPGGNTTAFVGARSETECMETCRKGQFTNYPKCVDCDIGYYQPYEGNRFYKCYQCPSGKTTLDRGSANITNCVDKCSSGEYFNITQHVCVLCPNNTYQDVVLVNNTRSCKECPLNAVTLSTGSASSSACLGPCSFGEYLDVMSLGCLECPSNTYNDEHNQTSFQCKSCPKHKITQNKGSTNISQCIYPCSQGEYFNLTSESCEKCANNTYQNEMGQGSCKVCPGNTFTLKIGSKTCIRPCDFGKFLNKIAEMCENCSVGYFQNETNYTSTMCRPCPLDSYADTPGRQNCSSCPDRGITIITAASMRSECIERCGPGSYLNKTARKCQKCSQGYYQDQVEYRYESCTKCSSANLTTLAPGATSSEQCVGYCASSPCLNGANCTNIDNNFNCSCPTHLTGKQCQTIIDNVNADQMDISCTFPNLIWNNNLSNPESEDFKKLAKQIENGVRDDFKSDPTFRTVETRRLRNGSVIADLEFKYVAGTSFGNPLDTLTTAVAHGKIGNLTVDSASLRVLEYTCGTPLGMENGRIPDSAFSSGNPDNYHPFTNARLNHNGPGWTPRVSVDIHDAYLQVDFGVVLQLTGIATQGSSYDGGSFLDLYRFDYSNDSDVWQHYREKGDINDYTLLWGNIGTNDVNAIRRSNLKDAVRTRYVRIIYHAARRLLSFRCEFYGCPIPKEGVLPTLPPRTDIPSKPTDIPSRPTVQSSSTGSQGTVSDDDDDDDDNVGLIVGVVLGVLAFAVLICVAVWCFTKNKRSSHSFGSVDAMRMEKQDSL